MKLIVVQPHPAWQIDLHLPIASMVVAEGLEPEYSWSYRTTSTAWPPELPAELRVALARAGIEGRE